MEAQSSTPRWLLVLGAFGFALMAVGLTLQPGCSGQACVGTGSADVPSSTIECPAGLLCYHGQCQRGCNAGAAPIACKTSDDCDSSRPNCIYDASAQGTFCSNCEDGEICVPALNICRQLDEVFIPENPAPPDPTGTKPNYALDASYTPMGLRPGTDAGPPPPLPNIPYTHALFIDVAQEADYREVGQPHAGRIVVRGYNVTGTPRTQIRWRLDHTPPVYESETSTVNATAGLCDFRRLFPADQAPTPANFGSVSIDSDEDTPGAINGRFNAVYAAGAYDITRTIGGMSSMTIPPELLSLSVPDGAPFQILINGSVGMGITAGAWPVSGESKFFVPYALEPVVEPGSVDLSQPQVITAQPDDLVFVWNPVRTGVDSNLRVGVRIDAGDYEISCNIQESQPAYDPVTMTEILQITDRIRVQAALLAKLRDAVGSGDYPIYFERRRRASLYIPGLTSDGAVQTLNSAEVRVRHTLLGTLRVR